MYELKFTLVTLAIGVICTMPAGGAQQTKSPSGSAQVEALNPFNNVVYIPDAVDPASIKLESVKMVQVADSLTADQGLCREANSREPGGAMLCGYTEVHSTPAYRVRYSYSAPAMASDEYGATRFTFDVYFRPEELNPEARQKLTGRGGAATLFRLSTSKAPGQHSVIDQSASKFCGGSFVDGAWVSTDARCEDKIVSMNATRAPGYVMVKVDEAPEAARTAAK